MHVFNTCEGAACKCLTSRRSEAIDGLGRCKHSSFCANIYCANIYCVNTAQPSPNPAPSPHFAPRAGRTNANLTVGLLATSTPLAETCGAVIMK